jgi:YD repeat-containing protein
MVERNILNPAVEISEYKNTDSFIQKTVNNYSNPYPDVYRLSNSQTRHGNYPIESRINYGYSSFGNLVHVSKDNSEKAVYLWGYNHQYPIAKIENATYTDVTGIISETALNTIAAKNEPAASDWNTVNGLRTSLPNALVTTYKYKPLSGMTEKIDPRGIVTRYEYDGFQRLKTVKDHNNSTVEEYEYHYKNQ